MKMILLFLLVACLSVFGQSTHMMNSVGGLTITLVASNSSTSAASIYNTSSTFRIRPGMLGLAMVVNSKASAPDTPSFLTTNANTWQQIRTTNYFSLASPTCRLTVFYTVSKDATPTLGAASLAASATGCIIQVFEVDGAYMGGANGTNALVQIVHGGGNVNTNATATLATMNGNNRNLAIAFIGGSLNSAVNAAESGWTKIADQNYNTPTTEGTTVYQYKDTDTSILVTNATAMSWAVVAVEIAQAGSAQ